MSAVGESRFLCSSIWRESVARFSSRSVRTRSATALKPSIDPPGLVSAESHKLRRRDADSEQGQMKDTARRVFVWGAYVVAAAVVVQFLLAGVGLFPPPGVFPRRAAREGPNRGLLPAV